MHLFLASFIFSFASATSQVMVEGTSDVVVKQVVEVTVDGETKRIESNKPGKIEIKPEVKVIATPAASPSQVLNIASPPSTIKVTKKFEFRDWIVRFITLLLDKVHNL